MFKKKYINVKTDKPFTKKDLSLTENDLVGLITILRNHRNDLGCLDYLFDKLVRIHSINFER